MQLYTLKLVTVVGEAVMKDELRDKMLELGATGFTIQEIQGVGFSDRNLNALFTGPNFRLECICPQDVAEAILTHVSKTYFDKYSCIAWVADVAVVRGKRFVKSE